MKAINIDEYLNENSVEITLNNKKFVVKDISEETQKLLRREEPGDNDHREIVKSMLGCTDNDLKGYGIAAFTAIITNVTKNLFPSNSQNDQ